MYVIEEIEAVVHQNTCILCGGAGKIPNTHPLFSGCRKCSEESRCPYCSGAGETTYWTSKIKEK